MDTVTVTAASLALFLAYAKDACNWGGAPLVGGNVGGSVEDRGNLTQLKKAGWIFTERDGSCTWLYFTPEGRDIAAANGVQIQL